MKKENENLVFGTVFMLAGIGALVLALFAADARVNFLRAADEFDGVVVGLEPVRSTTGKGTTWAPIVEWKDGGGAKHRFVSNFSSKPPDYETGDVVRLLALPADPATAEISSFGALWTQVFLPGGIGLAFMLASSFVLLKWRKEREAGPAKDAGAGPEGGDQQASTH